MFGDIFGLSPQFGVSSSVTIINYGIMQISLNLAVNSPGVAQIITASAASSPWMWRW